MKRTILVTGANRGIGLELAAQYCREGWNVLACCRNPEKAKELRALAGKAAALAVYRLDVADTRRIFELAKEIEGAIDILFNNAGTGGEDDEDFGKIDEKAWIEVFRVNTIGPLKMAEAFVNHVASSRGRTIAAISSRMGSIADNTSGGYYSYRTTKAALNMVMKNLSIDLKHRDIKTVCFHPGWVRTHMGGAHAPLSPQESVRGIRNVLSSLTLNDTGRFLTYAGEEIPW